MVFILDSADANSVKDVLKDLTKVYEIGTVVSGDKSVIINN